MSYRLAVFLSAALVSCANVLTQEKVRTESGCTVILDEVPPQSVSVRWNGSCDSKGLANGGGTIHVSGGEVLPYSESGRMDRGIKVGSWLRNYETIGVELKWMHVKNSPKGVDVHKVKDYTLARERQAYAFMSKVASEGDFASPVALGVPQTMPPRASLGASDHGQPRMTGTPSPTAQQSTGPFERAQFTSGGTGIFVQLGDRRVLLSSMDFSNCVEIVDTKAPNLPQWTPYIWRPDISVSWSGGCRDGWRTGPGTLTYVHHTEGRVWRESGTYQEGQRNGEWSLSSKDARIYTPSTNIPSNILDAANTLIKTLRLPSALASRLSEHESIARQNPNSPLAPAVAIAGIRPSSTCVRSINVIEQQYVNTYTFNGRDAISFRNNFGVVNDNWMTISRAPSAFEEMHQAQQERARARIPTKDPFGLPLPPQPRFEPADYTAAIAWARCLASDYNASLRTQAGTTTNSQVANEAQTLRQPQLAGSTGPSTNFRSEGVHSAARAATEGTTTRPVRDAPQDAMDCTNLVFHDDGSAAIANSCTKAVNASYCVLENVKSTWACEKAIGSTDAKGAALIQPRGAHRVPWYVSGGGGRVIFGACVDPATVRNLNSKTRKFDCR